MQVARLIRMRFTGLFLLAITSTAVAGGRPKLSPPRFATPTSFQSCQTSTMFACGMRDASGQTFGTAEEMTFCTRYTFQPDGTFSVASMATDHGRYTIRNNRLILTPGDGSAVYELALAPDGEKLGDMKHVR